MNNKPSTPFLLLILDGLGLNPNPKGNAVHHAETPNLDKLLKAHPNSSLTTHGERVGLPAGQMGNSEVGHLNIGGGRVVTQDLSKIGNCIRQNQLTAIEEIKKFYSEVGDGALHLVGLISQGGVHSDQDHLVALVSAAKELKIERVYIHAITDGRDRPPQNAINEIAEFQGAIDQIEGIEVEICSLIGRYYAMDRDKRWERTSLAYNLFVKGESQHSYESASEALKAQYENKITDEFLESIKIESKFKDRSTNILTNDSLLFFNFRADRMRQIVSSFLPEFSDFETDPSLATLKIASLTSYDENFNFPVLFPPENVENHLGIALAQAKYKQLRLAETEKYPHVTYFFNGGDEETSNGELRKLVPSPRDVPTYDKKPQMSVNEITDTLIESLKDKEADVYIVNFANCDMVGHTGLFDAAVKAVEAVDSCLGRVLKTLEEVNGTALITADHGNAEQMVDYETGEPHTFHTTYLVPIILYGAKKGMGLLDDGALCDISPTILDLLDLEQPEQMSGKSLLSRGRK